MTKKKDIKQIFENLEVESSDVHGETASSAKDEARQEGTAPHGEQAGDEAVLLRAEMLAEEQAGGEETGTDSPQSETKENLWAAAASGRIRP